MPKTACDISYAYDAKGRLASAVPVYHYYLQDHLGNNRVVVKQDGTIEQVNHYYPFGGLFGESTDGDVQRFKYNGKELDRLHGLDWYDYGARHLDAALGRWSTIDPMAEKYYHLSPYNYCHINPISRIDPDGKDDYQINADGYISFWRKSNARTTDRLYAANGENITISKNVTQQMLAERTDYSGNYAVGKGNEMINLFYFVANNTDVEWKFNGYKGKDGPTYLLATSHSEEGVKITNGGNHELDLFISIHNHPNGSPAKASGYGKNSEQNGRLFSYGDDQYNVNTIYNRFKEAKKAYPSQYPKFYIYHTETQTRIGYDPDKPITSVIKIRTALDLIK